jgi:transglutaminase superfamily protein
VAAPIECSRPTECGEQRPTDERVGNREDTPRIPRMPIGRRLSLAERLSLVREVLVCYRNARKTLRSASIEPAVEALRGSTPLDPGRGSEREILGEAWRLGRAVQLTLRLAPGDTRCLTRSLVLTQLLARRGIPSKLVIGARTKPSFLAHAWVEQAGQPVLPVGDESYGRLVEL